MVFMGVDIQDGMYIKYISMFYKKKAYIGRIIELSFYFHSQSEFGPRGKCKVCIDDDRQ